jgi:ActR/RegA family two-component response regulator
MRILIVEDNGFMASQLERLIECPGRVVKIARSGREAITHLRTRGDYKIIISDVLLGDANGIELIPEYKRLTNAKIIILTAYGDVAAAVEAIKAGAYDYKAKPFNPLDFNIMFDKCIREIANEELLAKVSGRIFLNYAREDVRKVKALYRRLKKAGYSPWIDTKDLAPGVLWEREIERVIKNSSFVLSCISRRAIQKRGMFQKELKLAIAAWQKFPEQDIFLIPVRLEEVELPESLGGHQWVDLFRPGGWERLSSAIRQGQAERAENSIKRLS